MPLEIQIVIAFLLDQLFGDPRFMPHPVTIMGRMALFLETVCRKFCSNLRLAGICTVCMVLLITGLTVYGIIQLAAPHSGLQNLLVIYLLFSAIAARDLVRHSRRVYGALRQNNLPLARQEVAKIVGRDTASLDERSVSRACVESVAESLVDGVTAPLFWAVIGGAPGALLYKAVNTMDSIFGYTNDRYREFGWAAAKLDDLANFIPARITAFMVMAAAGLQGLNAKNSFGIWRRDRYNHASPNSGHSEAAVAGALGVQLGGSSYYFGQLVTKPTIGDIKEKLQPKHILLTNKLMLNTAVLSSLLFIGSRFSLSVLLSLW